MRELSIYHEKYKNPSSIQSIVRERIIRYQKDIKERYDKNRLINCLFNVGDILYIKRPAVATGASTK